MMIAVASAVVSAWLAGAVALGMRRWRNNVLFRHGLPGSKDVGISRELLIAIAVLGALLGLIGKRPTETIALACAPALAFVVLTALITTRQARQRD